MKIAVVSAMLVCLGMAAPLAAADQIILVRHAEKAVDGSADPPLSEAGQQRADALAVALSDAGLAGIVVSQFQRTRDTAAPLAQALDLPLQVIPAGADLATHVADVVAALNKGEGRWLVVGHSNTITRILEALGGPTLPDLCDTSYSQALVFSLGTGGPGLQRWQYGASSPTGGEGCL